ncbi:SMI1/KNR4 family protein [Chitinophaga varians]|uniref:SMI1/KNR4 family protein n=1 Tax=Chitinophaga varians TaxID=2202339 RepID=UPI00165FA970|nr:SMI1/KNR4 family protein [Chitinophaga varians]MBC9911576.1 SMI1/KNR4 family protein [Chitinophaga varians]
MKMISEQFFSAYEKAFSFTTVYRSTLPAEMLTFPPDKDGVIRWKTIPGTLKRSQYNQLEHQFNVRFPESFITWHQAYFFLDGDCAIVRLPYSNPQEPLGEIKNQLDWSLAQALISQQLYPFAEDGNDTGPWVFDGRTSALQNEFPVRVYDHDFGGDEAGLSEVIFSSFPKMMECLTHYMQELTVRKPFNILQDFFGIDPEGAGKTGIEYWHNLMEMLEQNDC